MSFYHRSDCENEPQGGPFSVAFSSKEARNQLEMLLSTSSLSLEEWSAVHAWFNQLKACPATALEARYLSTEDDPMGRLLLAKVLALNPPLEVVRSALEAFPDAPTHNPAAFFTASRSASTEVLTLLTQHITRDFDETRDECPYPWIVSEHISREAAQAILEAYPRGVLRPSSFLCSYDLLDYFLQSDCMVDMRTFDHTLWSKFKLILVATQCAESTGKCTGCGISPIQVIMRRILARSDFWTSRRQSEHIIWLLHQLRWTDRWVFEKQAANGGYAIHEVLSHKCTTDPAGLVVARALVQLLLEAHPIAAMHQISGRLPLHLAVENGWPCHDLLLALHPEALNAPEPSTELFPFQTAAKCHQVSNSSLSLDMTFDLLRANPIHARSISNNERHRVGAKA